MGYENKQCRTEETGQTEEETREHIKEEERKEIKGPQSCSQERKSGYIVLMCLLPLIIYAKINFDELYVSIHFVDRF